MASSAPARQAALTSASCEPCRKSTPALSKEEVDAHLAELGGHGWRLAPFAGSGELAVLQKQFVFKNFRHALAFTNTVGQIAEAQKHHPEILLGWGHVDVAWWTHAIGGLHKNDFICAAKTDEAAQTAEGQKTA